MFLACRVNKNLTRLRRSSLLVLLSLSNLLFIRRIDGGRILVHSEREEALVRNEARPRL